MLVNVIKLYFIENMMMLRRILFLVTFICFIIIALMIGIGL